MQRIGRGGGGCCVELPANPCMSRENCHKMTVVVIVVLFVYDVSEKWTHYIYIYIYIGSNCTWNKCNCSTTRKQLHFHYFIFMFTEYPWKNCWSPNLHIQLFFVSVMPIVRHLCCWYTLKWWIIQTVQPSWFCLKIPNPDWYAVKIGKILILTYALRNKKPKKIFLSNSNSADILWRPG